MALAEIETTNLRIIHGTGNSPERIADGNFAAIRSNARIDSSIERPVMGDVFSIMLDVAALVTRGSDRARIEARLNGHPSADRANCCDVDTSPSIGAPGFPADTKESVP
jgi:hypothetical protein